MQQMPYFKMSLKLWIFFNWKFTTYGFWQMSIFQFSGISDFSSRCDRDNEEAFGIAPSQTRSGTEQDHGWEILKNVFFRKK